MHLTYCLCLCSLPSHITYRLNREKSTLVIIFMIISLVMFGVLGPLPVYLCRPPSAFTMDYVVDKSNHVTSVFGKVFKMNEYLSRHPGGSDAIRNIMGQDGSRLFPRLPPGGLPELCLNVDNPKSKDENPVCSDLMTEDELRKVPCHLSSVGVQSIWSKLEPYAAGDLVFEDFRFREDGFGDQRRQYIVIDTSVYDVTSYVTPLRDDRTGVISDDPNHGSAYLYRSLHLLIVNKLNEDATELYYDVFQNEDYKRYVGTGLRDKMSHFL
jgi:hypothetical protein